MIRDTTAIMISDRRIDVKITGTSIHDLPGQMSLRLEAIDGTDLTETKLIPQTIQIYSLNRGTQFC